MEKKSIKNKNSNMPKMKRPKKGTFVKRKSRSVAGNIGLALILTLFGLFSFFPVLFLINNAFKPLNELFIFPPKVFVMHPTLDNFFDLGNLMSSSLVPFSRYLFNTLVVVVFGTIGHIIFASMAAFPLAKYRFPGNKFISKIVVLALMFSPAVTAVPNYIIMSKIGLLDTYLAIILPAFSATLGLYLMMNFMSGIPTATLEAAKIDGANEFTILWKVAMPMVKPAWITIFIFSFQALWGNTGGTYIYTESLKPLSYALNQIANGGVARTGVVAAVSLIMFIIPVVVFVISQSNVLETMATSGMKD